jgi:hypothetical protein
VISPSKLVKKSVGDIQNWTNLDMVNLPCYHRLRMDPPPTEMRIH